MTEPDPIVRQLKRIERYVAAIYDLLCVAMATGCAGLAYFWTASHWGDVAAWIALILVFLSIVFGCLWHLRRFEKQ